MLFIYLMVSFIFYLRIAFSQVCLLLVCAAEHAAASHVAQQHGQPDGHVPPDALGWSLLCRGAVRRHLINLLFVCVCFFVGVEVGVVFLLCVVCHGVTVQLWPVFFLCVCFFFVETSYDHHFFYFHCFRRCSLSEFLSPLSSSIFSSFHSHATHIKA